MLIVVGLTGGIGSGKTSVSNILSALGASIINADKIGHKIYEPNSEGWKEVIKTFGKEILNENQEINRKKLGAIVFKEKKYLDKLNSITHPRIYSEIESNLQTLSKKGTEVSIVEAALLAKPPLNTVAAVVVKTPVTRAVVAIFTAPSISTTSKLDVPFTSISPSRSILPEMSKVAASNSPVIVRFLIPV